MRDTEGDVNVSRHASIEIARRTVCDPEIQVGRTFALVR
jgi:hypothetical protein